MRKFSHPHSDFSIFALVAVLAFTIFWAFPVSAQQDRAQSDLSHPFPKREKAPSLSGGVAWINTSGPLELQDLRGKFVILDFWTYCCINCMHILPELKKLEKAYPNELVVIGVHSAKFATEHDSQSITEAVLRYEIEHPVVNDSEHRLWEKYGVNSWPSLRVIDPEGYVVAANSGEIDFDSLDKFMKKALPYYRRNHLLDLTPLRFDLAAYQAPQTPLRFPGKLLADEAGGRLFIADSNHNRIVIAGLDGKLQEVIGSGAIGAADGDFAHATFQHPQGLALDGDTLYIADTENHMLRKADLKKKTVAKVAGTGKQGSAFPGLERHAAVPRAVPRPWFGKPRATALNSPWALWIHKQALYIAMAGPHQIWRMPLDEQQIGPYAGNGREDIVDGPLLPREPYEEGYASFAQPSGLSSDGTWLYVADSEGSSIRAVPFDAHQEVRTVLGTAGLRRGRLFTFGDVDGPASIARLQHPLDVLFHDGRLYVADTYNSKVKVVNPNDGTLSTLAGTGKQGAGDEPAEFREPTGLSYAGGKLYVADTNNHLIRSIDLRHDNRVATLTIEGLAPPTPEPAAPAKPGFPGALKLKVDPVTVKPVDGAVRLLVSLSLPRGYKINPLAPMRYLVEAASASGPIDRSALGKLTDVTSPAKTFEIALPTKGTTGEETLKLSLSYYYCQEGPGGLCKSGSVIWTVPVKLSADATATTVKLEHETD
jgi:thiol-disulfide isomerase/thioredoxin